MGWPCYEVGERLLYYPQVIKHFVLSYCISVRIWRGTFKDGDRERHLQLRSLAITTPTPGAKRELVEDTAPSYIPSCRSVETSQSSQEL